MKLALRVAGKILIVAFCIWHMAAVLIYVIPRAANDPIAMADRSFLLPRVTPYMLWTSQWQLWDLFSPDPLRRVTTYRIQTLQGDAWKDIEDIAPGTYPMWEHAAQFKFLLNILDEFAIHKEMRMKFLQLACAHHHVAPGTAIRLQMTYYVVPLPGLSERDSWWKNFTPSPTTYVAFDTICAPQP